MHLRRRCLHHRTPGGRSYCSFLLYLFHLVTLLAQFQRVRSISDNKSSSPIPNWEPSWLASAAQGLSVAISCRPSQDEECVLLLLQSPSRMTTATATETTETLPSSATTIMELENDNNNHQMEMNYHGLKLLLLPASNSNNNQDDDDDDDNSRFDHYDHSPFSSFLSRRWIPLGANAIATMTGLVSDVDHVQKRLQRAVEAQVTLYADDDDANSGSTMPLTSLVRLVSSYCQTATRYRGGRPRAIQTMLIGSGGAATMTFSKGSSSSSFKSLLAIYTIDPSGGWQHYGSGATAIGRLAPQARAKLQELLQLAFHHHQDDDDEDDEEHAHLKEARVDPTQTLQLAIRVMLETLESDSLPTQQERRLQQKQQQPSKQAQASSSSSPSSPSSHSLQAILIWKKATSHKCRVALVKPEQVKECLDKVWNELVLRTDGVATM